MESIGSALNQCQRSEAGHWRRPQRGQVTFFKGLLARLTTPRLDPEWADRACDLYLYNPDGKSFTRIERPRLAA